MNNGAHPNRILPSNACLPISHDVSQDWSHYRWHGKWRLRSRLFGAALSFPDFMLPLQGINDQGNSDFCTAETVSEAIGIAAGVPMSPEWQTAQIGRLSGGPIYNGADPKTALKSGTTYGALPKTYSPYDFARDGFDKPAVWSNYPDSLYQVAAPYKRAGYYNVLLGGPGDYDAFDMTRLALNDAHLDAIKDNRTAPIMGFGFWYEEWNEAALAMSTNGTMPTPTQPPISRHAYLAAVGLLTINGVQYIVAQLSQGPDFGIKGLCYYGRDAWNAAWKDPITNQIGMYIYRSTNPPFFNMVLEFINGALRYVQARIGG